MACKDWLFLYIASEIDVEYFLSTIMDREFDTIIEDGSLADVRPTPSHVYMNTAEFINYCAM